MAAFFRRGSVRYGLVAVSVAVAAAALSLVTLLVIPGGDGLSSDPVAALAPPEAGGGEGRGRVTLTEFADFNCGHCARFHFAYTAGLRSEFSGAGGVEFQFRHFPFLSGSSWSAALAYECAAEEGRGEAYHDLLFEQHLAEGGPDFSPGALAGYAGMLGLDEAAFGRCLEEERHLEAVAADKLLGESIGVRGTPTLFLNGSFLSHEEYGNLFEALESALAEADGRVVPSSP